MILLRTICAALVALIFHTLTPSSALAQALRVHPVTFDVTAPGARADLTLRNEGAFAITVQARVFAWSQDGEERLTPTREVVVSPPITRLEPGAAQTMRIMRTSRREVRGEDAYRIFVDELPDRSRRRGGAVSFVTRLRLPVFFAERDAMNPAIAWRIVRQGGQHWLEATNRGQVHLKLADISLFSAGRTVCRRNGLFGYILGESTMRWPLKERISGGPLTVSAKTNVGSYQNTVDGI